MYYQRRQIDTKKAKYSNVTTMYGGLKYDSMKEANCARDLDYRVKAGEITEWQRQVKLDLKVNGKHITNYYIDFIATRKDGTKEFIECKGFETEVWKLKWKLLEALIDEFDKDAELIVIK